MFVYLIFYRILTKQSNGLKSCKEWLWEISLAIDIYLVEITFSY